MSEHVREATDADFDAVVRRAKRPVLVDFWAPWCAPCRALAPALEQIAQEFAGRVEIVKIDVDGNPQTAAEQGVRSLPTLALFKNGRSLEARSGAVAKAQIVQWLERALSGR